MTSATRDNKEIAREEWQLLQEIIRGQEATRLTLRNWGITILTGLVVAALSDELDLSPADYAAVSTAVLLLFWLLEATYHLAERRAMDRSEVVEAALRSEVAYDGPKIAVAMRHPRVERNLRGLRSLVLDTSRSAVHLRLALPYLGLMVLVGAVAILLG